MLGLSNAMTSGSHHEQQYSLEFDGINDYLETFADGTLASKTYSFWMKASVTGENGGVFGHGGVAIGAFHINPDFSASNASKPLIYLDSHYWQYFDDTSAQDDGNWHHWAVYIKHDDLANSEVWVDGVALNTSTSNLTAGAVGANAYGKLKIGTDGDTKYFAGKIDEFAVFNGDLETDEVVAIYNNGKPFDLNYNRGNYVNSSDLEGYWRMFNGPFDDKQNGVVHDAHNPGFGSNLLSNADFSTNEAENQTNLNGGVQFDDWVEEQNTGLRKFEVLGSGRIRCTIETAVDTSWHQRIYQKHGSWSTGLVVGATYEFKVDILCSVNVSFRACIQRTASDETQSDPTNTSLTAGERKTVTSTFICTNNHANQSVHLFPTDVLDPDEYYEVSNPSIIRLNGYPGITNATATFSTDTPDD